MVALWSSYITGWFLQWASRFFSKSIMSLADTTCSGRLFHRFTTLWLKLFFRMFLLQFFMNNFFEWPLKFFVWLGWNMDDRVLLKIHDNIPHIKGVTATRVKHKCTGKLEVFITAGGGHWRCSRLSPVCPCAPILRGVVGQDFCTVVWKFYGPGGCCVDLALSWDYYLLLGLVFNSHWNISGPSSWLG